MTGTSAKPLPGVPGEAQESSQHQPLQWQFQFPLSSNVPALALSPARCHSLPAPALRVLTFPLLPAQGSGHGDDSFQTLSHGASDPPVPQPCPSHHPCPLPGLGDVSAGRRAFPCCSGSTQSPKNSLDRSPPPLQVAVTIPAQGRDTRHRPRGLEAAIHCPSGYQRGQVLLAPPCLVPGLALQPRQEEPGSSQGSAGTV